jgi:outer membrane receptor protein involved in Fe transport
MNTELQGRSRRPGRASFLLALLPALLVAPGAPAVAAAAEFGKVQGKVAAADTGEPMSYVDLLLTAADSSLGRVGGMTNADGTFSLDARPGVYTLRVRALSYGPKVITGIAVVAGQAVRIEATLQPEALLQTEVVVEARVVQNNESALLQQRRKASTVNDAISAEQVRRTPDRDVADVLRRVTGLSVQDDKYVFVRGLGERYSSTEVDGVRLVSPEANKRVVPLDLLPVSLIDNVVIQKTYSADRPAEFGGGDVQVRTRDFPGKRTMSFSTGMGYEDGTTGERVRTYRGSRKDWLGFGADFRDLPDFVRDVAGNRQVVLRGLGGTGFSADTLALIGKSFKNIWSPGRSRALPNGSYQASFGDEWKTLGRTLGLIVSGTYGRSQAVSDEQERLYLGGSGQPNYDYRIERARESVQLGAVSGLGLRLSPAHSLHGRLFYSRSADDEVRVHEGIDFAAGGYQVLGTRLHYKQRTIFTRGLEGKHEFRSLLGSRVEWKLSGSTAELLQPDRRDTGYEQVVMYDENDQPYYVYSLRSGTKGATREYGDQDDRGWGFDASWAVPVRIGGLGNGRVEAGFSHQEKERDNFYRRFVFNAPSGQTTAPPESLFQDANWIPSISGARVQDFRILDSVDNYDAGQKQQAGFLTFDLPWGPRLRSVLGLRVEHGWQQIRAFDLFTRQTLAFSRLDDVDWLPTASLNWSVLENSNLRLAASRTLSRPDLAEMAPTTDLQYSGAMRTRGNPDLERTRIDNYDLRFETFPGVNEVMAIGGFYKRFERPIERRITLRFADPVLIPENSENGRNVGLEIEARAALGRIARRLERFHLNANFSTIASEVELGRSASEASNRRHPLQGQAMNLANAALSWQSRGGRAEVTALLTRTGRRLYALGVLPEPDIYEEPVTTVDATVSLVPFTRTRLKLSGRNLTDSRSVRVQGSRGEVYEMRPGRGVSLSLTYGS